MVKRSFVLSDVAVSQLEVLREKYGLAYSDSVRRSIEILFNYLCEGKDPEGDPVRKIHEAKG